MEYVKGRYYDRYITRIIEIILKDEEILSINKQRIQEFIITLSLQNKKKSTILKYLSVMHKFIKHAKRDIDELSDYELKMILFTLQQEMTRAVFRNLKQAVKKYYSLKERNLWWLKIEEETDVKGKYITEEDLKRIFLRIAQRDSEKKKIFYYLLWKTGARVGELLLLRKRDISIKKDVVSLKLDLRAKNKPSRIIRIKDNVLAKNLLSIILSLSDDERVFNYSYYTIAADFRKLQKQVFNKVKYRLYDFRHTKATDLFNNEFSYAKICNVMGWDITSDVAKRYYHREVDSSFIL